MRNLSRGPTAAFVDKWRTQLSPQDQEVVEAICGPLMRNLGFEPDAEFPQAAPREDTTPETQAGVLGPPADLSLFALPARLSHLPALAKVEARLALGVPLDRQLLKRLLRLLEGLAALAVIGYLGWLIYQRWVEVRDIELTFQLVPYLVGCIILLMFNALYSFSWQTTLRLMEGKAICRQFARSAPHLLSFVYHPLSTRRQRGEHRRPS